MTNRSRNIVGNVMGAAFIVALVGGIATYEVFSWRECLSHDSWWYCLRILR